MKKKGDTLRWTSLQLKRAKTKLLSYLRFTSKGATNSSTCTQKNTQHFQKNKKFYSRKVWSTKSSKLKRKMWWSISQDKIARRKSWSSNWPTLATSTRTWTAAVVLSATCSSEQKMLSFSRQTKETAYLWNSQLSQCKVGKFNWCHSFSPWKFQIENLEARLTFWVSQLSHFCLLQMQFVV